MTRDEVVARVAEALGVDPDDEDAMLEYSIILFDGQESAFVGVAERFEPVYTRETLRVVNEAGEILSEEVTEDQTFGRHQYFAVYSYQKMIEAMEADGASRDEAIEYLEFNTLGAYVGETTPAIIHDERE